MRVNREPTQSLEMFSRRFKQVKEGLSPHGERNRLVNTTLIIAGVLATILCVSQCQAESLPEIPFVEMEPKLPKQFSTPTIDISAEADRQVIVDKDPERYFGHPSTLLMPDGKTMYCAYALNHAGPPLYYKVSRDGGLTWSDYLSVPSGPKTGVTAPSCTA